MLSEKKTSSSTLQKGKSSNATTKVRPHKRGSDATTRLKFHSKTCMAESDQLVFQKLDPTNPEQKRRLEQRRKMISYGKNTTGYEEYLKQVPKDKRRKRCMETPMTPDYTLDIPNKRWMGQVRAWRRALHSYDPPDLQKSLTSVANEMDMEDAGNEQENASMTIQDQELAAAKRKGLLVNFGDENVSDAAEAAADMESPNSVAGLVHMQQQEMNELDQWENTRDNEDFCSDDDSDDDLL